MVGRLVPVVLDLAKKTVLALFGTFLNLLSLRSNVGIQLRGVPAVVWLGDLVLPVGLNKINKLLAVGRSRERNIVVREPSLKLSLVPFIVGCDMKRQCLELHRLNEGYLELHRPALLNQVEQVTL